MLSLFVLSGSESVLEWSLNETMQSGVNPFRDCDLSVTANGLAVNVGEGVVVVVAAVGIGMATDGTKHVTLSMSNAINNGNTAGVVLFMMND